MPRRFVNTPDTGTTPETLRRCVEAMRDVLTYITAQQQNAIQPLPTTATMPQVIDKVNEVIARLQGTER